MTFAVLGEENPLEITLRRAQGDFSLDTEVRTGRWGEVKTTRLAKKHVL